MKTHLLLIAITFGALQMFAQIAPSDFIYQTTDNYEFSGTSGINPSLSDARFEPGNGDFSFRVAFTPKATANLQFIIDKGNGPHSANPGWCLAYENNNLYLRIGGNRNGTITKSIVQMPFIIANYLNQEVVVAGTMERSTGEVHLYLNGDRSTEIFPTANTFGATHTLMTSDFSISNATFPLTLGSRSDANNKFTGTISDFKTYNYVLSTTQMTTPPADYLFSGTETMEFSGNNYEAISDFYPNTGSMTILFCIVPKITSAGSAIKNIAGSGNTTSTASGWNIMMGEGYIGFRTAGTTTTGNYRASARIPFADATYLNREVFGAAVIDRANNKVDFYIDGTNANTEPGGYGPTSNILDADKKIISTSKFSLGQNSADGNRFTGTLKSLSIYHRVLSAHELSAWKTTTTIITASETEDFTVTNINGYIVVTGINAYDIYSLSGQMLDKKKQFDNGVYILRTKNRTIKLIINH